MALLVLCIIIGLGRSSSAATEMAITLTNITRLAAGDLFSLSGSDCSLTRCMEVTHGTALTTMGSSDGCVCQCRPDTPTFREDQRLCVYRVDECLTASYGRGTPQPLIPLVFLPLKGQIIYPAKDIVFTDVEDAICAVTSAQYLTPSGWMTLRDVIDNDVPFGLYRDEGKTYLQWRGSATLHARLEGRLVTVHVLCTSQAPVRLSASCASFRIAGANFNALLADVRSIPFHAGETVTAVDTTQQSQGLSVLECLAIGVCVLMLVFVYAAGILFYIHYKKRQKKKDKDPENSRKGSCDDSGANIETRLDMDLLQRMKTNPLLDMNNMRSDFLHDTGLSDLSEHTEDTLDSSPNNTQKFQKANLSKSHHQQTNVISAMVHTRRKKPSRPSIRSPTSPGMMTDRLHRRSASPDIERAPQSDLSIVDCSVDSNAAAEQNYLESLGESSALRRKLYFNPVFFEAEYLKNPPPAAIDFLVKIREVMSIAKDKMTSKRFAPILSDIPEEELYHTIDLGWDIPCARRGRRFSAISLKRENSRRSAHCGGCPGCNNSNAVKEQKVALVRSNSCKSCVSDEFKQKIVKRWLDEVPSPPSTAKPTKSVAKVSGTPRFEPTRKQDPLPLPPINPAEPVRREETKTLKVTDSIIKANSQDSSQEAKNKSEESTSKEKEEIAKIQSNAATSTTKLKDPRHTTRRVRKKLPPPPPPPDQVKLVAALKEAREKAMNSETEPGTETETDVEFIPKEVKKKMQAVIKELNHCRRVEPKPIEEMKLETVTPIQITPKIVIPVLTTENQYYSDDNLLADTKKREKLLHYNNVNVNNIEMDSLDRNILKKRRFSVACGGELNKHSFVRKPAMPLPRESLSSSWKDIRNAAEGFKLSSDNISQPTYQNHSSSMNDLYAYDSEPIYGNVCEIKPGPLTIEVRGSPVEQRKLSNDNFEPDTLDRKPKNPPPPPKPRIEKIVLKSGGSFKCKPVANVENIPRFTPPQPNMDSRQTHELKIGSLRQIFEAKAKAQEEEILKSMYHRRGSSSMSYDSDDFATFVRSMKLKEYAESKAKMGDAKYKQQGMFERRGSAAMSYDSDDFAAFVRSVRAPDLIRETDNIIYKEHKPPIPPKQRRVSDLAPKFTNITRDTQPSDLRRTLEEIERFQPYGHQDLNARRSGRRSARTRQRRTDLRKVYRTEDSGYLSTDSNESKRRAQYLLQLRPRVPIPEATAIGPVPLHVPPQMMRGQVPPQIIRGQTILDTDTDDLESICDGVSESGGESIETDSVFFGNFDESKEIYANIGMNQFEPMMKRIHAQDQMDSGFIGETNIILSGDSDSEHRSVISIMTGRSSSASMSKLDESPFMHTVEC